MNLPSHILMPARAEPAFDWFARKAAQLLSTPVGLVSLVTADGEVWPGAYGLPDPWDVDRASPLSHSFCQYVVTTRRPFLVTDAHDDPLVALNKAVIDLGVVAYAGVPLTLGGSVPGALSAIDHRPRRWTEEHLADLQQLADLCSEALGHRLSSSEPQPRQAPRPRSAGDGRR